LNDVANFRLSDSDQGIEIFRHFCKMNSIMSKILLFLPVFSILISKLHYLMWCMLWLYNK
jgi:hypothetical protein